MREEIGNVTLIFEETYEKTEVARPEDPEIIGLVEAGYDCRRGEKSSWPVLYHLSHLRANLTEWLPIKEGQKVLEFGSDSGQLTGGFLKKGADVTCIGESVSRSRILARRYEDAGHLEIHAGQPWELLEGLKETFDWIIAVPALPEAGRYFGGAHPQSQAIRELKKHLKADGHLLLAADNRFGLKYWAGAMEPHTGRYFDSLEGRGDTLSKAAIRRELREAGIGEEDYRFYYPYPERWFPFAIYSDEWLPKKGELNRNLRNFEGERLVLFDETSVYDQLIEDGRFPDFANCYLVVIGPRERECPIFVKYSNDRAEEYSVRTEILNDGNGRKVRKVPLSEAAAGHLTAVAKWEESLKNACEKAGIGVNHCLGAEENGGISFEYLEGETFEERLDRLRENGDHEGLSRALLEYRGLLQAALAEALVPFRKSETFVEMFGNPEFSREYEGAMVNNLDWIFSNLVYTSQGLTLIDYEWTFPVQVPVEYVIWRALSLYLNSREDLKGRGYLELLGITQEEERIFEGMEQHFQRWLLGGVIPIGEQYIRTAGRTISLAELTSSVKRNRVQVYVDSGDGFSEEGSFYVETEPDKRGVVNLEILLPPGAKGLRIDPAEETCLLKMKSFRGELGGSYELSYIHNGRELQEQGILYTTADPQITATNLVEGTSRVYAEFTVEALHPDTAHACMELLNRVRAAERLYRSAPFRVLKKLKNILK